MTNTITAKFAAGNGKGVWWAYINGELLRKSNGVAKTFKTEASALRAGSLVCK